MDERKKRSLIEKGIDVDKVDSVAKELMISVVDAFSIAEIEFLINRLTSACENLKYRKPGEPIHWKNEQNWVSINLPKACPNVCIFFDEKTARSHLKETGAKPLYGFDGKKEDWLLMRVFITYGGSLAPSQRLPEM